ncbi:MAG: CTP synthase [Desulfarculales bacterium]|jgi:CTP synthase|nr:CTP synthase [Desulfarculales bacterium]
MHKTKFIFVTGGVLSSLGKGLAAASIGAILKSRGLKVSIQKLDPYLNVDPGTMNPFQHGEVYVTDDGAETDLDLGHYERYLGVPMGRINNYTAGRIYNQVIAKERRGEYLGGTVQVIPQVTDEIKAAILSLASPNLDVALVEVGGTVGDIESLPFLEAIRQLKKELGPFNSLYVHLTLVPYLSTSGEHKSKPTQHSVKELRGIGIQPDIIIGRCEEPLPADIKRKIALFCNVDEDAVFSSVTVKNIYEVPLRFYEEGVDQKIAILLQLPAQNPNLTPWRRLVQVSESLQGQVTIAIVGKYVELKESYKSLHEALAHGGLVNGVRVNFLYLNSEELIEKSLEKHLRGMDGILIPGGFGMRGVDGKLLAVTYAREYKVPFFGICLGMQCMVIEFARKVAGLSLANSEEFDPDCPDKIIYLMSTWYDHRSGRQEVRDAHSDLGGTMRLGAYPCRLERGSLAQHIYGQDLIHERHRHRFEFNNKYMQQLSERGLVFSGFSPDGQLVEMVELKLKDHPWFVGCQFHPEFKSYPMAPHPLFRDFIRAAKEYSRG